MRLSLLLVLFLTQALVGAEPPAINLAVEVKASFGDFGGPRRRLTVSLGELPADEHIDATIKLVNVTQSPIEFLTLESGCSCLEAKVVNPRVAPGEAVEVSIRLHTRVRTFGSNQVTTFRVETKQDDRVESSIIALEYTLKGIVAFPDSMFHHEIPVDAKTAELRLPLLVTEPVIASDLEVDTELNVVPEFSRDPEVTGKWWIVFPIDPSLLQNDISLFDVKVTDPSTGRNVKAVVSLTRATAFRVTPRTVRFRRSGDTDKFVATSVIQVASVSKEPTLGSEQPPVDRNRVLFASATMNGKPVQAEAEWIGKNVFRVKTQLLEDQLPLVGSKASMLHWDLACGDAKAGVQSPFSIDRR